MELILALETSTKSCSVALLQGEEVLAYREEHSDQYIHSEKLHLFIEEVMKSASKEMSELTAVAVGKGPGSYTGLRIGVSAAKGICYALGIPLVSANGLDILFYQLQKSGGLAKGDLVIPMIDARRMEVYCAIYKSDGNLLKEVHARVLDELSFSELEAANIHILGDASVKAQEVLQDAKFQFHDISYPSARALAELALERKNRNELEDVAYFEPFYLKDFVAGKPKKLL